MYIFICCVFEYVCACVVCVCRYVYVCVYIRFNKVIYFLFDRLIWFWVCFVIVFIGWANVFFVVGVYFWVSIGMGISFVLREFSVWGCSAGRGRGDMCIGFRGT